MNKRDAREKHQPRRGARFSATTKGIRLLPEQDDWVNEQLAKDPEETYSRMVREGLRLLKKQREGLIQVLSVVAR